MLEKRTDITSAPFILNGFPLTKNDCVIEQDAGRSADIAPFTVMAKIASSGKYVPLTDVTATDGSAKPAGILLQEAIATADVVAGDVSSCTILVGGAVIVDIEQLVLENSVALDDTIGTGITITTVQDELEKRGIFVEATTNLSNLENS